MPSQIPGSAAGAIMLPIPAEGTLRAVRGVEGVQKMSGVRDVIIAVEPGQTIVPFPEQSCYIGFVTAAGQTTEEVEDTLNLASQSISLELEPVVCQTWECSLDPGSACVVFDEGNAEDLSAYPVSQARDIASDILARAQFAEFAKEIAVAKARHCLEQLETGCCGKTFPEYWFTSKRRGVIIGANAGDSGFIACLAVLPEFRRMGVAETLVRFLMRRFAKDGHTVLKVVVDPREPAALATYRRLGFSRPEAIGRPCCCA